MIEVPVRFEQIGRLLPHAKDGDWTCVFRHVQNLKSAKFNFAKRKESDGDIIFVLEITDTSWARAEQRVLPSLKRGIKVRRFGDWTMLDLRLHSDPEEHRRPVTQGAVPLDPERIDAELMAKITGILERLAEQNDWYLSDWRYEMSCSCGPIDVRLLRSPPNDEIVEVRWGSHRRTIWLTKAPSELEHTCRKLLEEPPAESNL